MKIFGNNIKIDTEYYKSHVTVEMDVDEFDDIDEVINTISVKDLVHNMDAEKVFKHFSISEILEYKNVKDFVEYNCNDFFQEIIELKGEGWVLEHISDSGITSEARSRNIDTILNLK